MLTREEHAEICSKTSDSTVDKLNDVLRRLEQNRLEAQQVTVRDRADDGVYRERMYGAIADINTRVGAITTDVAVLKSKTDQVKNALEDARIDRQGKFLG